MRWIITRVRSSAVSILEICAVRLLTAEFLQTVGERLVERLELESGMFRASVRMLPGLRDRCF